MTRHEHGGMNFQGPSPALLAGFWFRSGIVNLAGTT